MKRCAMLIMPAALAAASAVPAPAQAAAEILAKVDANSSFKTIRYSGRMEITIGGETRVKTMEAAAEGTEKAFIEFTNPEDRGVRYLKLDKNLWMYFPKEQDTVKISGHLLKEGMMGSDLSYEDALESKDYKLLYAAAAKGEAEVEGRRCYMVELTAKAAAAPYDRRLLWIDAERWVPLKEEMYAKSGKLLKTSRTLEVKRLGDRWFPVRSELVSALRRDTKTAFFMDKVEINPKLDQRQFTMAELTR
jgi:outer membrane lipoprotein-sorting protein